MEVDELLIQRIEQFVDGSDVHKAANLVGTYRQSLQNYRLHNDLKMLEVAHDIEHELRALLTRHLLRKGDMSLRKLFDGG